MPIKGRHQSTCKAGKQTLAWLRSLEGVKSVVIGISIGGKSIGKQPTGHVKIQRGVQGGFKGLLQSSKGVQEIFIQVDPARAVLVRAEIELRFRV